MAQSAAPANQPPAFDGQGPGTATIGRPFVFTPGVTDPDRDTLRFSATALPAWAMLDPATGSVSGTPGPGDVGSATLTLTVHDGTHSLTLPELPLAVLAPPLGAAQITVNGLNLAADATRAVGAAAELVGDVHLSTCGFPVTLRDARLRATFDADDRLTSLVGEADVPERLSPWVSVGTGVKAYMGWLTGREINANDGDFDVTLLEDAHYFVYVLASEPTIEVGDRNNASAVWPKVTIAPPLNFKSVFIADPCDTMSYQYRGSPAGDVGFGESDRGLLPFVPNQDYAALDRFNGHRLQQGKMGIGVGWFDMFEISGTLITRNPDFKAIDWNDPLNAKLQFKAGINGNADFSFGVKGVGLFSFHGARASTTFDVGTNRGHMAMQATIEPDVSWQPNWFPILPSTQVVGRWFIHANGRYEAQLSGNYHSTLPQAHLSGLMRLDPQSATMLATVHDDRLPLTVSLRFADRKTTAQIATPQVDLGFGVQQSVKGALARELAQVQQAFDALVRANADYEFEASLRGLRGSLPGIVDTAVATLNAVPGQVRNSVDSGVVSTLRKTCKGSGWFRVCAADFVNESKWGDDIGAAARKVAAHAVAAPRASLLELKRVAQLGDDASLRSALQHLLNTVYANRTVTVSIPSYSVSAGVFGRLTVYKGRKSSFAVLSPSKAEQVRTAAALVPRIQQTSDLKIGAQQIFDAMPTRQAIEQAQAEVDAGLAKIPQFEGAGYEVDAAAGTYTAFVVLSGQRHGVAFNVLDPVTLLSGIGEAISRLLVPR